MIAIFTSAVMSCDAVLHAHSVSLALTSWSEARSQLEVSRGSAVQHYWSSISSNSGKLVAASSEVSWGWGQVLGVQLPQGQGPPATGLIGTLAAGLVDIVACRGATRVLQKRKCSQQEGGQSKGLWRQLWGPDRGLEVGGATSWHLEDAGSVSCACAPNHPHAYVALHSLTNAPAHPQSISAPLLPTLSCRPLR
jgi:hypothetical protein